MASLTQSVLARTSPERLWALVRDVNRVAGLFSYTGISDFSSPEPGSWRYWRTLEIPTVARLRWREESHEAGDMILTFTAVEGDLDTFAGTWQVAPDAGGARLTLAVEFAAPADLRRTYSEPLVNYVMMEMLKAICQRVKEAAEEDGA